VFNIQPGQGLGFTGSREIALGLGTSRVGVAVIAEQVLEGGPSDKYFPTRYINNEDEEIMTVITSFLTIRRH